jgi:hypothetical protein
MPPRCCNIIHLALARPHLTADEIAQFKAKHEEWNTPNRLYCPVPACSTFISPRLINTVSKADVRAGRERQQKEYNANTNTTLILITGTKPQVVEPSKPVTLKPSPKELVVVECPTCSTPVCVACKQFAHPPLPCSDSDISPELSALLKKWKVKRCPKCRAAVRRMYGCPHIRCRCGGQWCWFCLGPIDECRDNGCPEQEAADRDDAGYDSDSEEDGDEGDQAACGGAELDYDQLEIQRIARRRNRAIEIGDLDAQIERREALDLGDEPNADEVDPWNCNHVWRGFAESTNNLPRKLDCQRCWRELQYEAYDGPIKGEMGLDKLFEPNKVAPTGADAGAGDAGKEPEKQGQEEPAEIGGKKAAKPGVECRYCSIICCYDCKEDVDAENKLRWEEYDFALR